MAQEKNGCLIFLAIVLALAAVGVLVVGLAYVGLTMIIGLDLIARSFTWLGIESPIVCWLALGLVTGAFVGVAKGLTKAQRSPGWPVYGGAAVTACLILLAAYYAEPVGGANSNQPANPPYRPPSVYNPFRIGNVTANVSSLLFFEEGEGQLSKEQRAYNARFSKATTRYVGFELNLTHADAGRQNNFAADWAFYKPDGTVLYKNTLKSYIKKGWTSSYHSARTGWNQVGNWAPGTYKVVLSVDGKNIATGQFEIY